MGCTGFWFEKILFKSRIFGFKKKSNIATMVNVRPEGYWPRGRGQTQQNRSSWHKVREFRPANGFHSSTGTWQKSDSYLRANIFLKLTRNHFIEYRYRIYYSIPNFYIFIRPINIFKNNEIFKLKMCTKYLIFKIVPVTDLGSESEPEWKLKEYDSATHSFSLKVKTK